MQKTSNFFKKHYYATILFCFTALYYIIFIGVGKPLSFNMSTDTYIFYFTDFSMGFSTKFLQGAIYNFFFDDMNIAAVSLFNLVLFFFFLALISILFGVFISSVDKQYRTVFTFLAVLFLTGPSSLTMHYYKLGSMDSYWLYFAILSLLCLYNKHLYCFIIPLSVLSVLISYGSILNFIPFIVILMIYKSTVIKNKNERILLSVTVIITIAVSIGFAFYFIMFEKENLTYTLSEFTQIIKDRGFTADPFYYKSSLYDVDYNNVVDYDYINSFESPVQRAFIFIWHRMLYSLNFISLKSAFGMLIYILPPVFVIFLYFTKRIKEEFSSHKIKAFSYLCCLGMFFITAVTGILVSTDTVRFLAHAYTLLFASFFFTAYYEKHTALGFVKDKISLIPMPAIILYTVFYIFSFFDPVG